MATEKIEPIYEKIVNKKSFTELPETWTNFDLVKFSKKKKLYDYQQESIRSALKLLYLYNQPLKENFNLTETKKILFNKILNFDYVKSVERWFGINSKNKAGLFKSFKERYPVKKKRDYEIIDFYHFVNRMGFWMATGSGKTLVLIKLIEILNNLQEIGEIPRRDFLILTYRKDLIEQIKEHIFEFNRNASDMINIWDLKDYKDVKTGKKGGFLNKVGINVFIYRSDLISDETGKKLLNFEDIDDNRGEWYLFLDEAHKGETTESKRQAYYSLLTRNGFLFNFSATFTHKWDILTTVYNFNLQRFIEKGYGKNICLLQENIAGFSKKEKDFKKDEKRKIILKSFLLLSLLCKNKRSQNYKYHNPLLMALVNSVNTTNSDLELFFAEIENIVKRERKELFSSAKKELISELESSSYEFTDEKFDININDIKNITKKNVLKNVFNTTNHGSLEVINNPNNKKEIAFKVKTGEEPFALIRIGDKTVWIKNKLRDYSFEEKWDEKSIFKQLNKDKSSINLLLGSRTFYEGWDSDRPNIMMFINIGRGKARKFVLQAIGRGVRIQPIQNRRKRLKYLKYKIINNEIVSSLETLFIFGTYKKGLDDILETVRYVKNISGEIIKLKSNSKLKNRLLLIPKYKIIKNAKIENLSRLTYNKELIKDYLEWLEDEKFLLTDFPDLKPNIIKRLKNFIKKGEVRNANSKNLNIQIRKLISHVASKIEEYKEFKELEDEIVHFKKINVNLKNSELKEFKNKISKVQYSQNQKFEENKLKKLLKNEKINIDEYTDGIKKISKKMPLKEEFKGLNIQNVVNHYYIPLLISKHSKKNYINHIIDVPSERIFIDKLNSYLDKNDNLFDDYEFWAFSKIDEYLDNVYIPYKNTKKFKPDFIFWLKKENTYLIIFIDPKGKTYTDYEDKIDGYKKIFENQNGIKKFTKDGLNIKVELNFFTENLDEIRGLAYINYWFEDFEKIL